MIYVQFYQKAVWPIGTNEVIEACGDRSVIILDGRNTSLVHHAISRQECQKRGYIGYRLFKGESFTRSSPISDYLEV